MSETNISCELHGPYCVSGQVVVKDDHGNEIDLAGQDPIYLCRCGQSGNKPFCDGSHEQSGFRSDV
jgi:CDGSH-type Zn-finger protein